jgi:sugar phosphate permease
VARAAQAEGARPAGETIKYADPSRLSWPRAIHYVLAIRTNLVLIIASSLGYYFLAGVRTFAVVFFRGRYELAQAPATLLLGVIGLGSIAGVVAGGRVADWLLGRGRTNARVEVTLLSFLLAAALFLPGLLTTDLALSAPFFFVAGAALAAANAPLDAARLDIVPFHLWGRAESVRSFFRTGLQGIAPLTFGFLSDLLGGTAVAGAARANGVPPHHAQGLDWAFLLMLVPVVAAALMLLAGRRTYPTDVATAAEAQRRMTSGT